MLTLIDRYILGKAYGTLFYILLMLTAIIIVFDISQKIDDFIENEATMKAIMTEYYINFIPALLNMLLPLFIFVSVIFFTSRMASRRELIAIFNSGASLNRVLLPYFLFALSLTIISIYLYNFVIPHNQKIRWKFEYTYITPNRANVSRNIHRQIAPGVFVYMESFVYNDSVAYRFSMDQVVNKRLVSRLSAQRIVWNRIKKKWTLEGYVSRQIKNNGDDIITGVALDTSLNFNPRDFIIDEHIVDQLDYHELNRFIKKEQERGSEMVVYYQIEKYQRLSIPFSSFILTLIGFCVSFRAGRKGMGSQLLIGLALSFSYIILLRFTGEFAKNDLIPIWLAVWTPNIFYGIIALILYIKARFQ